MTEQKFVTLFDRKTDYAFVAVGRTITKIGRALAAVTLLAIPVIGLNWGIDFAGGAPRKLPHFDPQQPQTIDHAAGINRRLPLPLERSPE